MTSILSRNQCIINQYIQINTYRRIVDRLQINCNCNYVNCRIVDKREASEIEFRRNTARYIRYFTVFGESGGEVKAEEEEKEETKGRL